MSTAAAISGAKRRAGGVTLDDIYARHTWLWWWDGAHGVDTGADTWTDRVGSYVLSSALNDVALSAVTVSGQSAVRMQPADVGGGFFAGQTETPDAAGTSLEYARIFLVLAPSDTTGLSTDMLAWNDTGGALSHVFYGRSAGTGVSRVLGDVGAESQRTVAAFDNAAPHVVRAEYNGTNASHVLRVDGVAGTAIATDDATFASSSGKLIIYREATMDVIAMFASGYAAINDTQAAQVETDLLTIMGL